MHSLYHSSLFNGAESVGVGQWNTASHVKTGRCHQRISKRSFKILVLFLESTLGDILVHVRLHLPTI